MQSVAEKVIARAKELLASGEVQRVLGWEKGEFDYERTPALFEQGNIDKLVYDKFCAPLRAPRQAREHLRAGRGLQGHGGQGRPVHEVRVLQGQELCHL